MKKSKKSNTQILLGVITALVFLLLILTYVFDKKDDGDEVIEEVDFLEDFS